MLVHSVSWGDAPGFHIAPRCGKPLRKRDPLLDWLDAQFMVCI